jgi:hypothetical protein
MQADINCRLFHSLYARTYVNDQNISRYTPYGIITASILVFIPYR